MNKRKLIEDCRLTLKQNDLGLWTRPAPGLYPHQWLWDSCFIAVGLRHFDVKRAQIEIDSLFRGQWKNGMMPNIIHGKSEFFAGKLWDKRSPDMPTDQLTSGITQPPMIAQAMVKVGECMNKTDRTRWYKSHFNQLLAYHEWLYRERDPSNTGLVTLIHPWESGVDNSPSWMHAVHSDHIPFRITLSKRLGFTKFLEKQRKDTKLIPASERIETVDALLLFYHADKIERYKYNNQKILQHSKIALNDVLFNSILTRANSLLQEIADEIDAQIPSWLSDRFKKAQNALDLLRDKSNNHYYDRTHHNSKLLNIPTIGRYLPLYSGAISHTRAKQLAVQLQSEILQTPYPVASVPPDSVKFNQYRYWQGPSWVNTNWLIIDGLQRYGFIQLASDIKERTLRAISLHGAYEYFSPLDGSPVGAHQFSWSAALAIDLAKQR